MINGRSTMDSGQNRVHFSGSGRLESWRLRLQFLGIGLGGLMLLMAASCVGGCIEQHTKFPGATKDGQVGDLADLLTGETRGGDALTGSLKPELLDVPSHELKDMLQPDTPEAKTGDGIDAADIDDVGGVDVTLTDAEVGVAEMEALDGLDGSFSDVDATDGKGPGLDLSDGGSDAGDGETVDAVSPPNCGDMVAPCTGKKCGEGGCECLADKAIENSDFASAGAWELSGAVSIGQPYGSARDALALVTDNFGASATQDVFVPKEAAWLRIAVAALGKNSVVKVKLCDQWVEGGYTPPPTGDFVTLSYDLAGLAGQQCTLIIQQVGDSFAGIAVDFVEFLGTDCDTLSCVPDCDGKKCGSDGCWGQCGTGDCPCSFVDDFEDGSLAPWINATAAAGYTADVAVVDGELKLIRGNGDAVAEVLFDEPVQLSSLTWEIELRLATMESRVVCSLLREGDLGPVEAYSLLLYQNAGCGGSILVDGYYFYNGKFSPVPAEVKGGEPGTCKHLVRMERSAWGEWVVDVDHGAHHWKLQDSEFDTFVGIKCNGSNSCGGPNGGYVEGVSVCTSPFCTADCQGSECGADGCGGACQPGCSGQDACVDGSCICQPACKDKVCGPDGCGGECKPGCTGQDACTDGQCVCQPACTDKECGDDGCGGKCQPGCAPDEECAQGLCQPLCGNGECVDLGGETECTCPEDCGACAGCCNGDLCVTPVTDEQCGQSGADCVHCMEGKSCQAGACEFHCGDGLCGGPETCDSCPGDCGDCCGNALCDVDFGELCSNCPQDCGECAPPEFVTLKAGGFWMGSPAGGGEECPVGYAGGGCNGTGQGMTVAEPGRDSAETLHYVDLVHDFEIQMHEVTQGEWKAAFGSWNPSYFVQCGDNCPVEYVSWHDACAYANWKSEKAGLTPCYVFSGVKCEDGSSPASYKGCLNGTQKGIDSATVTLAGGTDKPYGCAGFRLPAEAEWEYAVRAGSLTAFYPSDGNDGGMTKTGCSLDPNLDKIGWYCGNSKATYGGTHDCSGWYPEATTCGPQPFGGKEGNAWGLTDMCGNVWEWCSDWHAVYGNGTQALPDEDPFGGMGSNRVLRGGCWYTGANGCRSAFRHKFLPTDRAFNVGLRLVRSLEFCGDGECNPGEDDCNCPADCTEGCAGCCQGSECKAGASDGECGKDGAACAACTVGKTCQGQACTYKCGDGVCADAGGEMTPIRLVSGDVRE